VVKVPGVEAEEARHLHRELEVLWKERTMHRNRIHSLLILQGIVVRNPGGRKFLVELETLWTWDGREVSGEVKARIIREHGRLRMVEEQIYGLKKEQERRVKEGAGDAMVKVRKLMGLVGIGRVSASKFLMEAFGWREFRNRREAGALAGLTPTPYDSGGRGAGAGSK
jgi:transposase